jgi:hypothetical protein
MLFLQWGYNRAGYTRSDVHIAGPGFGLTLHAIQAKDRPSAFDPRVYFTPSSMWIPQYVYRLGMYVTDRWSISVGLDHMKYVMVQNQVAKVTGAVSAEASQFYSGGYDHVPTRISRDFLAYEHTDGLNYLGAEADWNYPLYTQPRGHFGVVALAGGGTGAVICRTEAYAFERGMNTKFHPAGFGFSAHAGFKLFFLKHFYVNATAKGGFVALTDILLQDDRSALASQNFAFRQFQVSIGGQINTRKVGR